MVWSVQYSIHGTLAKGQGWGTADERDSKGMGREGRRQRSASGQDDGDLAVRLGVNDEEG